MEEESVTSTLWMGDLEPYMDEFFILQAFDQMGETAKQVKLIHSKFSGTGENDDYKKIFGEDRAIGCTVGHKYPELRLPAGYCFVDFRDGQSAQRAMLRLNGKIIPNSQPPCRFKLNTNLGKEGKVRKEFSLFVGELSDDVDDYILYHAFKKRYPSCHTAKVVFDGRGVPKGFGFVRFSEETEQQRALIEMQHSSDIGRKQIRVSLATPKKSQNDSASSAPSQPMPPQHPSQHGYYNNPSYYGMNAKTYEEYLSYQQQYYYQYYQNAYNAAAGQGQAQGQVSMPAAPPSRPPPQNLPNDPVAALEADALEEPELTIDVEKYNRDYMEQSEEVFELLEDSRWHPMDQWNSRVPTTAR